MEQEAKIKNEYFKAIKKRYRKGPFFAKLKRVGGKPNWENVRNYTLDELKMLMLLGSGKTVQQNQACEERYKVRIFDLPSDWYSKVMKSCWNEFAQALGNREILKKALEKEQELVKVYKLEKND